MKKHFAFLFLPLVLTFSVIGIFVFQQLSGDNFYTLGIYPRRFSGLPGIMFAPLIHSSWEHLLSNLSALPFLTGLLTALYRRNYFGIFTVLYFSTGIAVWIFARESYHIGASGLIYALASFLFFGGIISNSKGEAAVSLLTVMLYGSMIWGIFPGQEHISWESHALGAVSGFFAAMFFVKEKKKKVLDDENFDYKTPCFKEFSSSEKIEKINYCYKK